MTSHAERMLARYVAQAQRPLLRRLQMMLARGKVAAVSPGERQQTLQIKLLPGEVVDGVEHIEPYGFTSHPHAGAEVLTAFIGGDRTHGVVLVAGDRRHRPQGIAAGEVRLYDDQQQTVHIKRDGIKIEAPSGKWIEMQVGNTILRIDKDKLRIVAPRVEILQA